jgi:hypothetical protein
LPLWITRPPPANDALALLAIGRSWISSQVRCCPSSADNADKRGTMTIEEARLQRTAVCETTRYSQPHSQVHRDAVRQLTGNVPITMAIRKLRMAGKATAASVWFVHSLLCFTAARHPAHLSLSLQCSASSRPRVCCHVALCGACGTFAPFVFSSSCRQQRYTAGHFVFHDVVVTATET